ncbi:flagellar motor protein MotA [Colwellia sp. PAMC 20917]|jgi:biopolymer transport protein ExbB|uniref:MotA/TolQ/ExbB proton channel family protein n=1 Tax=unclassified Colwellia TaxID=196834 RepID=UPI000878522C|nr:flagellar motor protein MotA [Colwellia sp. PAMC 20917]MBA6338162.1 MotA/TolQ/ExbB proton channel family protein [Colwellia sp. BRX8-7]MBA6347201.1 MotA/TolQ/ExbB proton channel family protein [Colwellia sp. BRX8-9]MBA6351098.1 MotA/TolQ/ExbB proton channel family protein [Colwellia sp. BRX9-1]MBA6357672.1 MotA/TolQ/ExbB proton channel family protein [Colwellia sp. BRX8-3]MBA6358574.1 MotA/TolQ/ExbB proton channel family protein [Colwellia sp. BRX8-6]MBA6366775.1 MotA/TolQ/ExbB proton chan
MRKIINFVMLAASMTVATSAVANDLDDLLKQVKNDRISEGKLDKAREAEFTSARADKQALLNKAKKELANQNTRNDRLTKEYAANDITIAQRSVELDNAKGTLGEMFGVTRAAAADAYGQIVTSIVSAEFPGRGATLDVIANSKKIPELEQLEELWIALQTEMTQSGKISQFSAEVTSLDGSTSTQTVTRIGTFNLVSADGFLNYNDEVGQIQPLAKQPAGYISSTASDFFGETSGYHPLYVDPSRGGILALETRKKVLMEFYHEGGTVGYAITVLLVIGFLIALERMIFLTTISSRIKTQEKNIEQPNDNNPLGRLIKVYHENKNVDAETLELKLDEAILRETPKIDRGINLIKMFAAIAPLMGLLGTVIGMIMTFQTITLFGTGDPKIMAGDISLALVTTALGLICALPLILIHSVVAGKSKSVLQKLDEQSAGLIAAIAEKESK